MATPDAINFMATHGRGLICLSMTRERCETLDLKLMSADNASRHQTAFTVSIEARDGISTGISAHDRARIVAVVRDGLVMYSTHKLSSNVVEKCLDVCAPADRSNRRESIQAPTLALVKAARETNGGLPNSPLLTLMSDQYGCVGLESWGAQAGAPLSQFTPPPLTYFSTRIPTHAACAPNPLPIAAATMSCSACSTRQRTTSAAPWRTSLRSTPPSSSSAPTRARS
jgi:hypothetical protein